MATTCSNYIYVVIHRFSTCFQQAGDISPAVSSGIRGSYPQVPVFRISLLWNWRRRVAHVVSWVPGGSCNSFGGPSPASHRPLTFTSVAGCRSPLPARKHSPAHRAPKKEPGAYLGERPVPFRAPAGFAATRAVPFIRAPSTRPSAPRARRGSDEIGRVSRRCPNPSG